MFAPCVLRRLVVQILWNMGWELLGLVPSCIQLFKYKVLGVEQLERECMLTLFFFYSFFRLYEMISMGLCRTLVEAVIIMVANA